MSDMCAVCERMPMRESCQHCEAAVCVTCAVHHDCGSAPLTEDEAREMRKELAATFAEQYGIHFEGEVPICVPLYLESRSEKMRLC